MTPVDQDSENSPDRDLSPVYGEIDALLDGEVVDRTALRAMLDDPAARDYFVDALALRQLAREMEPGQFIPTRGSRSLMTRVVQWAAAVAILIAGAGAGYLYGHRGTVALPSSSSGSLEVTVTPPPPLAPEPTRSIRFEPGVNWTSQSRSH
jgi:hypothetical protein